MKIDTMKHLNLPTCLELYYIDMNIYMCVCVCRFIQSRYTNKNNNQCWRVGKRTMPTVVLSELNIYISIELGYFVGRPTHWEAKIRSFAFTYPRTISLLSPLKSATNIKYISIFIQRYRQAHRIIWQSEYIQCRIDSQYITPC